MNERLAQLWRAVRQRARGLPKPTGRQLLKAAPFVVAGTAMLVLVVRNDDTIDFPDYDAPEGFVADPPATTLPPGFQRPSLAAVVAGTTTTVVPANVGTSHLTGSVVGPTGPVPGALVRIERSILGEVQVLDLLSDATGRWDAPGLGGGRYRVRAFLPPTLTQRTAEVFLLPAGEERVLDLLVEQFSEPSIAIAIAPDPAFLDQQLNVVVRITGRFVDAEGFVGTQALVGGSVEVTTSAGWQRNTPPGLLITDGGGHVVVNYTCRSAGAVQVQATVRSAPGAPPLMGQAVFECVDPATLPPTTVPSDPTGTTTSTTFQ